MTLTLALTLPTDAVGADVVLRLGLTMTLTLTLRTDAVGADDVLRRHDFSELGVVDLAWVGVGQGLD